jgi:hypothetical protein
VERSTPAVVAFSWTPKASDNILAEQPLDRWGLFMGRGHRSLGLGVVRFGYWWGYCRFLVVEVGPICLKVGGNRVEDGPTCPVCKQSEADCTAHGTQPACVDAQAEGYETAEGWVSYDEGGDA